MNRLIAKWSVTLFGLLALVTTVPAMVVSAWTPTTVPKYYYGTYNPVNYTARPGSGEKILSVKLYIGGNLTFQLTNQSGTSRPAAAGAVFDSTHFAVGSGGGYATVETHLDVVYIDSSGNQQTLSNGGSTTIPVKNRALIATIGQPPFNSTPYATTTPSSSQKLGDIIVKGDSALGFIGQKATLAYPNYNVTLLGPFDSSGNIDTWTFNDLKSNTSPNNIVIVNTHGSSSQALMEDGAGNFTIDPQAWSTQIETDFGTDALAPFNATALPPINLLFLICCIQGNYVNNGWAFENFPYENGFQPTTAWLNQVTVGFKVAINATTVPSYEYWLGGMTGDDCLTISQATYNFVNSAENVITECSDTFDANGDPTLPTRKFTLDDIIIAGDPYMRVHGVYTGSNSLATAGWWR